MKTRLNISDEVVITQGDEAKYLYVLMRGSITVLINQKVVEANYNKFITVFNARNKFHKLLNRTNVIQKGNDQLPP